MFDRNYSDYESAEAKVKQCKEKGSQNNIGRLLELEAERDQFQKELQKRSTSTQNRIMLINEELELSSLEGNCPSNPLGFHLLQVCSLLVPKTTNNKQQTAIYSCLHVTRHFFFDGVEKMKMLFSDSQFSELLDLIEEVVTFLFLPQNLFPFTDQLDFRLQRKKMMQSYAFQKVTQEDESFSDPKEDSQSISVFPNNSRSLLTDIQSTSTSPFLSTTITTSPSSLTMSVSNPPFSPFNSSTALPLSSLSSSSSFLNQGTLPSSLDIVFDSDLSISRFAATFGKTKGIVEIRPSLPSSVILYDYRGKHNSIEAQNIVQINRSRKQPRLASILFKDEDNKYSTLPFELTSLEQRERFHEAMSFIKTGTFPRSENISIFIGTWNAGDAAPPSITEINKWIPRGGYDLYAIGTQECSKKSKDENPESKEEDSDWFNLVQEAVGDEYVRLCHDTLLHMNLIVLVHRSHKLKITNVRKDKIATGIANIVGNKGGVAISLFFNETSLCFVNSHLAAHQHRVEDRNQNYKQIVQNLRVGNFHSHEPPLDIHTSFDYLFWFGDLNYRLDSGFETACEKSEQRLFKEMFLKDQLHQERLLNHAFSGFHEGEINFPPTYRYARGECKYTSEKMRTPSWCDRVLFKNKKNLPIQQLSYSCSDDILTSDHHPVFSTFNVATILPNLPIDRSSSKAYRVVISNVEAYLKSSTDLNSFVDASSSDLVLEFSNPILLNSPIQREKAKWDNTSLDIVTRSKEFLQFQQIYLRLLSKKKEISEIAQGSISLTIQAFDSSINFDEPLYSRGVNCGLISGKIQMTTVEASYSLRSFSSMEGFILVGKKKKTLYWSVLNKANSSILLFLDPTCEKKEYEFPLLRLPSSIQDLNTNDSFELRIGSKSLVISTLPVSDQQRWKDAIRDCLSNNPISSWAATDYGSSTFSSPTNSSLSGQNPAFAQELSTSSFPSVSFETLSLDSSVPIEHHPSSTKMTALQEKYAPFHKGIIKREQQPSMAIGGNSISQLPSLSPRSSKNNPPSPSRSENSVDPHSISKSPNAVWIQSDRTAFSQSKGVLFGTRASQTTLSVCDFLPAISSLSEDSVSRNEGVPKKAVSLSSSNSIKESNDTNAPDTNQFIEDQGLGVVPRSENTSATSCTNSTSSLMPEDECVGDLNNYKATTFTPTLNGDVFLCGSIDTVESVLIDEETIRIDEWKDDRDDIVS